MTLVYAHRGASAEFPENTMEAFARAVELGVDVLETDAHMTTDAKVVLAHDDDGRRKANDPRLIRKCTYSDVRRWDVGRGCRVPLLEEVLRAFPSMRFNIDAKEPDFIAVDRILEVIKGFEDRVQLSSFHAANLRRIRARGFRGPTGLGQSEVIRLVMQPGYRPEGNIAQVPVSMGPIRFDTKKFIDKAHGLGLRVDYWVVNEPETATRLCALGADGIMTDDPAKIVPVVKR
jgi:glycerophosphoryl diester phosphodiesterase